MSWRPVSVGDQHEGEIPKRPRQSVVESDKMMSQITNANGSAQETCPMLRREAGCSPTPRLRLQRASRAGREGCFP